MEGILGECIIRDSDTFPFSFCIKHFRSKIYMACGSVFILKKVKKHWKCFRTGLFIELTEHISLAIVVLLSFLIFGMFYKFIYFTRFGGCLQWKIGCFLINKINMHACYSEMWAFPKDNRNSVGFCLTIFIPPSQTS